LKLVDAAVAKAITRTRAAEARWEDCVDMEFAGWQSLAMDQSNWSDTSGPWDAWPEEILIGVEQQPTPTAR